MISSVWQIVGAILIEFSRGIDLTHLPPQLLHRIARTPPQLGAKMCRLNRAVLASYNIDDLFRTILAEHIFRIRKRSRGQFLLTAHTRLEVRQRRGFLSVNRLFYAKPLLKGIPAAHCAVVESGVRRWKMAGNPGASSIPLPRKFDKALSMCHNLLSYQKNRWNVEQFSSQIGKDIS